MRTTDAQYLPETRTVRGLSTQTPHVEVAMRNSSCPADQAMTQPRPCHQTPGWPGSPMAGRPIGISRPRTSDRQTARVMRRIALLGVATLAIGGLTRPA